MEPWRINNRFNFTGFSSTISNSDPRTVKPEQGLLDRNRHFSSRFSSRTNSILPSEKSFRIEELPVEAQQAANVSRLGDGFQILCPAPLVKGKLSVN